MSIKLAHVAFDCTNSLTLSAFWSAALDQPINEGASEFFAAIAGSDGSPTLFFLKVPEAKTVKNRVHVDFESSDPRGEVDRLVGLGATKVADKDEWGVQWSVMQDIEGNEFCVSGAH